MPHVARYFSQRAYDSSFETCLKKSKLDYSALCKKDTEDYISLQSERGSPSGFYEHRYYGSHKGERETPRASEDFLNGLENEAKPGLSRYYPPGAQSRRESKPDYSAVCKERNTEGFISLEAQSERGSPSGFSETRYYGSDKDVHKKPRVGEDFLNGLDSKEKSRSSSNYSFETYGRRESKPYYSALCKKTDTEEYISLEAQSEQWGSSEFSEAEYYGSDEGEYETPRVHEDFPNGLDNESKPGSCSSDSTEAQYSNSEDPNTNQQILELPKADEWKKNSSKAEFSETSTAFIGPLYPPPPKVESVSRTTHNDNSKSPSFRIATVVSEKAANRTKGEDGINYELRQFYKELHELEAAANDQNIIETTADGLQCFSSQLSNAPTVHQVRDHPGQQSSSQPCNTLPSKQSAPNPPSWHPNEAPVSPAERPTLPPINKQDFYDRPVPFDRNNSFVSQTLPPPGFGCPPPSPGFGCPPPSPGFGCPSPGFGCPPPPPPGFGRPPPPPGFGCPPPQGFQRPPPPSFQCPPQGFQCLPPGFQRPPRPTVHNVPPPPRPNPTLISPRGDNMQNLSYHENEKYHSVNDDHPRPSSQAPWRSTHVPSENRFCPEGRGYTEPFPEPLVESSQQAYQRKEFCAQKDRHFNQTRLQGGDVPHEQYPPRFRDEAECTDFKRKLVMLRGVPGSGKSTLARTLLDRSPGGIVFSTDDYFCQENGYTYDMKLLGDAHSWNQNRARRAMDDGRSPIIIDNTNIQGWEMKPYVQLSEENLQEVPLHTARCVKVKPFVLWPGWPLSSAAARVQSPVATADWLRAADRKIIKPGLIVLNTIRPDLVDGREYLTLFEEPADWYLRNRQAIERSYGVEFLEPNTWWKLEPHELERRNTHRVPREKISQMLERFEHDMNVGMVMNSLEPRHVRSRCPPPEARQR